MSTKSTAGFFAGTFSIALVIPGAGMSQDFPNKPVRILASEVGGGGDFTARLLAPGLARGLGQPVIVENRGTMHGVEIGAKATPDGHTILVTGGTFLLRPLLEKTPYDPVADFAPITWSTTSPNILVVHPSVPAKSVKELIALAKSKPGELNYAMGNRGSTQHIAGELLKSMAGVRIVEIPYKQDAQQIADQISGRVQLAIGGAEKMMPIVDKGQLRALAVTSPQPSALLPALPTVASAVPGYSLVSINMVVAPAKTPAAIVKRLNQELVRVLNDADVKKRFLATGSEIIASSPEQTAAEVKSFTERVGKVIRDAGIRAN